MKNKKLCFYIIAISLLLAGYFVYKNHHGNNTFSQLTSNYQGTFGIYAVDTNSGKTISYNANQHFPVCSTAKAMIVAAVLEKSMRNENLLHETIHYPQQDVSKTGYAPITKQHISTGMSIQRLAAAAIKYSDNTASNLLVKKLGGIKAITEFARSIGDDQFRLDRLEPELNSAIPGDIRDTSTPKAMAKSLEKLLLGNVLATKQRKLLTHWLIANTTGSDRIRAAVPQQWVVGDKTGTGDYGTTNDIAIVWPPRRRPIIIIIYFTQNQRNAKPSDKAVAQAASLVMDAFNAGH